MRAEGIHKADHAFAIAKGEKVFAKQAYTDRSAVDFGDFF
jgi:hypothetical protein